MMKFLLLVFLLNIFTACTNDEKITPSGKKIYIRILASLSGNKQQFAHQSLLGMKTANKMKKYLSNGDEIALHVEDTKTKKESFIKALNKIDKSKIIVTFEGSNTLLNLKENLLKVKIPIISTLATNNKITSLNQNMIQVCMDNNTQALVAAHFVKDEKFINHVGIIYDKTNKYSSELAKQFNDVYTSIGGNTNFIYDISTPDDFEKFKAEDKSKINLLYSVVNAQQEVVIVKLLKEQNVQIDILSTDGLFNNALENEKDNIALFDGTYVIEHYSHKKLKNKHYQILQDSSHAFLAYDAYQLIYYALDNCVEYDKECISSILKNSAIVKGISGNFSMVNSKAKREVYVDKIEGTKLVKVIVIN